MAEKEPMEAVLRVAILRSPHALITGASQAFFDEWERSQTYYALEVPSHDSHELPLINPS